ncbi:MAG: Holliday junction DNA helicase RuvA [Candidatus Staskawiczbacteria bacterium RIFCSPHIGHO2_02_FULL_42_22]|uniref:Holliday junction branch migration complex subunit RuvA n=1 Tax=Candidatus Staskawiczbacteria bacterium RIFCSPHIGHO2_02_FULL_42_22 TaxID=1802207 RepID=A0A1G2I3H2_9BACT|nr:MAG: Holliday junction DNA helicase RuvA [Candidatus Staskawiczbacteria bacterium RIFCSPHIGHO2_02_FULL_42_22]
MISYLKGSIILKKDKFIIVETGGIGYKVFLSNSSMLKLPEVGSDIKLFCFQNVKEDALDLYGFLTYDELDFFEVLMDIRGVGPKSALDIAALGSLEKIKDRILKGDVKIFESVPGIGTKKAMTIILELTGKIKMLSSAKSRGPQDGAEDALTQLGFSRQQAREALKNVPTSVKDMEERIKQALKIIGK